MGCRFKFRNRSLTYFPEQMNGKEQKKLIIDK